MRVTLLQHGQRQTFQGQWALQLGGDPAGAGIRERGTGRWSCALSYNTAGELRLSRARGGLPTRVNGVLLEDGLATLVTAGDRITIHDVAAADCVAAATLLVGYRELELPAGVPLAAVERELLEQIAHAREDVHVRRVLADHWEETGDAARGELVHRQCEPPPGRTDACADLVEAHAERWWRPLVAAGFSPEGFELERGFLRTPLSLVAGEPLERCADLYRLSPLHYRELRTVFCGSNNLVAEARARTALGDHERVAVKTTVPWRADTLGSIEREYRILARFSHPNLARLRDVAIRRDGLALVLDWAGPSLAQLLRTREHGFGEPFALAVAIQLCAGLAAAHAADVVHANIRPDHVLVRADGAVTLVDFGSAQCEAAPHWHDDQERRRRAGTFRYQSPDQVMNHAYDGRADLFAVAMLVCVLVDGRHPLGERGNDFDDLTALRHLQFRLPAVSAGLRSLLARVLVRAEDMGPRTAAALAEELTRVAAGRSPPALIAAALHDLL